MKPPKRPTPPTSVSQAPVPFAERLQYVADPASPQKRGTPPISTSEDDAPHVAVRSGQAPSYRVPFGERLQYVRKLANLSQGQLADQVGISRSCICQYESQKRGCSTRALLHDERTRIALEKIAKVCGRGVSVNYLLGIPGAKSPALAEKSAKTKPAGDWVSKKISVDLTEEQIDYLQGLIMESYRIDRDNFRGPLTKLERETDVALGSAR